MKGLGFVLGWLATLLAIVALTVLVTGGEPLISKSAPSIGATVVKLAAGVVLVVIGYRRRNRPTSTAPKKEPRWMASIDRISPLGAAGLAFLLQPWVMVAAGVATITQAKFSNAAEWLALLAFCLWCTASYLTMEIYAVLRPEKVKATLTALLEWINTHTDQAIVFLSLGLGLYLMARSIYTLTTL
jgi:small neutral amino acid transporter SnatA (MarC family)